MNMHMIGDETTICIKVTMMKYFWKSLVILLALIVWHSSFAASNNLNNSTKSAITRTILVYIKKHTAIPVSSIKITNVVQNNNYVRANVVPSDPVVDPAIAFLKYTNNHWRVLSLGTAFDAAFYQRYQIPEPLQLK